MGERRVLPEPLLKENVSSASISMQTPQLCGGRWQFLDLDVLFSLNMPENFRRSLDVVELWLEFLDRVIISSVLVKIIAEWGQEDGDVNCLWPL